MRKFVDRVLNLYGNKPGGERVILASAMVRIPLPTSRQAEKEAKRIIQQAMKKMNARLNA